ncbi:aldose 1-epimerase family protein [Emticicia sp. BO119]|uniref:aldose 1-epimerase family protein n=1 Tax=Emticicia sp. BO119 TaxID=2757768 RepID=UPI0015EFF620|nr:aldose 1-epimerase family protein [Emticicia sp. BO119]MBA4851083.1 aldose 1-epimerase family protein [Emticicia sp. BO119]
MIAIKNADLGATINPKGAELISLIHHASEIDFMWSADPAFWGKSSPVLFPIVGSLKEDSFIYKNTTYHLPRHGFARDRVFVVENQTEDSVTFLLKSDEASLKVFPFEFEFRLNYKIEENQLHVKYEVTNTGEAEMYFSVGGHPAFKVPVVAGTSYEDFYLEFNVAEDLMRWPLTKEGLIEAAPEKLLVDDSHLPLTKELFYQDALVFKHLQSDSVTLKSDKTSHQLKFDFKGFPFLGIWAAKNADFVCIEPWFGIADSANHNQQLTEKEGINQLNMNETFERTWGVRVE